MERVETRNTSASEQSTTPTAERRDNGFDGGLTRRKSTLSTVRSNDQTASAEPAPKKRSLIQKSIAIWQKTGIDSRVYRSMFKSSIAPTITLALYQLDGFANYYTTLGYLAVVMTILSVVMMPRAKFLQTMLVNLLFLCLGAALSLLAMYCCIKARRGSTAPYDSSASAVAAVWLVAQVFSISVVRAKLPQYVSLPVDILAFLRLFCMTVGDTEKEEEEVLLAHADLELLNRRTFLAFVGPFLQTSLWSMGHSLRQWLLRNPLREGFLWDSLPALALAQSSRF